MTSGFSFLSILDVDFTRRAADKLEEALKKKDQDLAEAQKEASSKTKLAEEKLASVGALEQENSRLKTALETANRDASRLKKEKMALHDKGASWRGRQKIWRLISEDSPRSCSSCSKVIIPTRLSCSCRARVRPLSYS